MKASELKFYHHPTSDVEMLTAAEPKGSIGDGTKIWRWVHVMNGAVIGARCILGQGVFVAPGVKLGNGVKVQNNVSLYDGVELEDDVFIGPSVVFTNVKTPRAHVERKDAYEKTIVRRGASIGANSTVLAGVELGMYCFVGASSFVNKDVQPFALVYGQPARWQGWMCVCGEVLSRQRAPEHICEHCLAVYKEHIKGGSGLYCAFTP